jgi:hypothetical protein
MSCHAFPERNEGVPRATVEHMPFIGHRNCAQWGHHTPRIVNTNADRKRDAVEGSAELRDAIKRAAR